MLPAFRVICPRRSTQMTDRITLISQHRGVDRLDVFLCQLDATARTDNPITGVLTLRAR